MCLIEVDEQITSLLWHHLYHFQCYFQDFLQVISTIVYRVTFNSHSAYITTHIILCFLKYTLDL
uniref:Putative ovule protein n=1 Tax=Solanum chacoense TaxID=4108 RepID=A0A0V0GPV9_SOLCH